MPAASYTELTCADNVTVTSTRVRINQTTLDWQVRLQAQIVTATGEVIKVIDVDAATLFSGAQMTTFKGMLNTGLGILATNRSITTNV